MPLWDEHTSLKNTSAFADVGIWKDGIHLKLKSGRMPLFLATVVLAAVGFLLRLMQLRYVFDDSGLPVSGSGLTFALVVVCCAAALLLLLGCGGIPKR
jgi:hypothetical protein